MKLQQLFEHSDMYQILGHDLSSDATFHQPIKGSISNSQDNLTRLFGESAISDKPEWVVEFTYRPKENELNPTDPLQKTNPPVEKITVKISLKENLPDDRTVITDWNVSGKNMVGLWVLEQFIEHNK